MVTSDLNSVFSEDFQSLSTNQSVLLLSLPSFNTLQIRWAKKMETRICGIIIQLLIPKWRYI